MRTYHPSVQLEGSIFRGREAAGAAIYRPNKTAWGSERRTSSCCRAASARRSLSTFTHQTAGVWNRDRRGAGDWLACFQRTEDVSILEKRTGVRSSPVLGSKVWTLSWNGPAALAEIHRYLQRSLRSWIKHSSKNMTRTSYFFLLTLVVSCIFLRHLLQMINTQTNL